MLGLDPTHGYLKSLRPSENMEMLSDGLFYTELILD